MRRIEVAVALGALALASSAGAAGGKAGDFLDILPADTTAVVVVKLAEIRSAPLYHSLEDRCLFGRDRADFDDFVRVTGVDPSRDIDETLVAIRGRVGQDGPGGVIGLISGRFDTADLTRRLTASGAPIARTDKEGTTIFRFAHAGKAAADALAFPSSTLAVFGDEASVQSVCDGLRNGSTGVARDSGLRAAFEGARHSGQLWGAFETSAIVRNAIDSMDKKPAPLEALASLEWISFDADLGSDLRLTASGQASTGNDAELVRQSLDGFLAFAKLGAKEDAELLSALAEVNVERQGDRVTISATVPRDLVLRHTTASGAGEPGRARQR